VTLRIAYQDPSCVVIDKPAGFQVHPPEDVRFRVPGSFNCLRVLSRQLDAYVHPVHRIDRATSGVVVFALDAPSAADLNAQFATHAVRKVYFAVVRGWLHGDGQVEVPLKSPDTGEVQAAHTRYREVARVELDVVTGPHPTSRYTLVRAEPLTGRTHQVRRHLKHLGHPLVGDVQHGDAVHNRLFRGLLGGPGLLLKAYSVEFRSPATGTRVQARTRWNDTWHRVFDLFGACPCEPGGDGAA
jgi:tRNA pseudouridine65 synthase